jgi:hypothetical protein
MPFPEIRTEPGKRHPCTADDLFYVQIRITVHFKSFAVLLYCFGKRTTDTPVTGYHPLLSPLFRLFPPLQHFGIIHPQLVAQASFAKAEPSGYQGNAELDIINVPARLDRLPVFLSGGMTLPSLRTQLHFLGFSPPSRVTPYLTNISGRCQRRK